jgi:hypothetical protein
MQKVITVVLNHAPFYDNTTNNYEIAHAQLNLDLAAGFTVKESIPLSNVQDANAGISIITFILEQP